MKGKGSVARGLLMITQIGISMIVPIFLGVFLGYRLDRWLGTGFFFLVFLLLGILAAFRNIYKLTKPFYAEDLKREKEEQAYWDSLKPEGRAQPQTDSTLVMKDSGSSGAEERRRRMKLCGEQGGGTVLKSRREAAEEEFAAWRREREKSHDGSASDDDTDGGAGDRNGE
ncbi:MAG: AtpZ/AtpI family protein [Lachnospiraceae bacterium]|nr:AtpZ/AtpI family protein [Lachnospiraceae bacterium]